MKVDESNFITFIRRKKEDGILYVIDTYGGYLRAIVRQKLSAMPSQVDDCMNDVFLGIWKNIGSYDGSKGSFKNWAAGIARLEAVDYLRKEGKRLQDISIDGLEVAQEDTAMLALVDKELSLETQELLSCLSPKDQELFLRIYGNEEEPGQVSAEMGLTRDNLYVRLFRGKRKIRMFAASKCRREI